MALPHAQIGPWRLWLEKLTSVRALSWLSPCIWAANTGVEGFMRHLLHQTRLGRLFVDAFYNNLSQDTLKQSGILRDKRLKPLIPPDR